MIAARLIMRAHVERPVLAGRDAWGAPIAGVPTRIGVVSCYVWSTGAREIVDGDKTATVEEYRALFPIAAGLRATDEIVRVTDRMGRTIFGERLRIEGDPQQRATHAEADLRRIG